MKNENLYLIRLYNENETFYKIGLTVHRFCRFYEIMKSGYSVDIIYMIHGINPNVAMDMETLLHNEFKKKQYYPQIKFAGHTECFSDINLRKFHFLTKEITKNCIQITKNVSISWR